MFVLSTKITKGKVLIAALAVCCAALVTVVAVSGNKESVSVNADYVTKTNDERVDFLKDFGWTVSKDPVNVSNIVIPTDFDTAYETYNNIQREQGLDLTRYKGEKAVKYTYEISNYPNSKPDEKVNANLIVVDETVVAGDVCSTALGGFMHGFSKPASATVAEQEATDAKKPTNTHVYDK